MRILITGGSGFIGSHTTDELLRHGHEVRVLDNLVPPVHLQRQPPHYLDPRVELLVADVCNESDLLHAMKSCDVIYHFAAFQDYLPVFSQFVDVNVTSTARIYELIVRERLPIKKVIIASSQATLGEGLYCDADGNHIFPDIRTNDQLARGEWNIQPLLGQRGPLRWCRSDETVANPQNPYGLSKIAQEHLALHLGKQYEIPTVALRYSIVQGPRQSFFNAYSGACRIFCLAFHQNKEPTIYEDGKQIRDFVNIQDVVEANMIALHDERAEYEVFNVGGDKPITVAEFAKLVSEIYGRNDYQPIPSGKYRFGDTRHIVSDVTKLKSLGWKPTRSIALSVEAYKHWLDQFESIGDILNSCTQQMTEMNVVREVQQ